MSEALKYIENILLEIVDRPCIWLEKGQSNKYILQTFDSSKAAFSFLKQYKQSFLSKGQKVTISYNNQQLHLIVRHWKYGHLNQDSENCLNTTVQFVYRQLLFGQIKWPKVSIKNKSEDELTKNQHQSKRTNDTNHQKKKRNPISTRFVNHISSLSSKTKIKHFQEQNFQFESIENSENLIKDQSLTLGHTNDEQTHFPTPTTITDFNQNYLNTNLINK